MDYAAFVALRRAAWDAFERQLETARRQPRRLRHVGWEDLAVAYRLVLHDQALAQARFPGTAAVARLRRLALEATSLLRTDTPARRPTLATLATRVVPRAARDVLPELLVVASLFVAAMLFGLAAVLIRPESGALLLGPERLAELAEGVLWTDALTSTIPPAYASSVIATNNLSVALLAWAGGALAGLGALYVALVNGLLLGATLAVTVHYSMAGRLLEFVSAHGPLEISLILLCAAAGLSLGRALVVAEDRPRREVVREAATGSVTVLLACLPAFLVLALVESVVSPQPEIPAGLKAALGIALPALLFLALLAPTRGDRGA